MSCNEVNMENTTLREFVDIQKLSERRRVMNESLIKGMRKYGLGFCLSCHFVDRFNEHNHGLSYYRGKLTSCSGCGCVFCSDCMTCDHSDTNMCEKCLDYNLGKDRSYYRGKCKFCPPKTTSLPTETFPSSSSYQIDDIYNQFIGEKLYSSFGGLGLIYKVDEVYSTFKDWFTKFYPNQKCPERSIMILELDSRLRQKCCNVKIML